LRNYAIDEIEIGALKGWMCEIYRTIDNSHCDRSRSTVYAITKCAQSRDQVDGGWVRGHLPNVATDPVGDQRSLRRDCSV